MYLVKESYFTTYFEHGTANKEESIYPQNGEILTVTGSAVAHNHRSKLEVVNLSYLNSSYLHAF